MSNAKIVVPNEIFFERVEELLDAGQRVRLTAKGYSMRPTLKHCVDEIELVKYDPATHELKRGDVVLFVRADGHKCVHRIVRRQGDVLYIRGDGNIGPFEIARTGDVIALIVAGTMFGGRQFTASDRLWIWQGRLVMAAYPVLYVYRRTRRFAGRVLRKLHLRK